MKAIDKPQEIPPSLTNGNCTNHFERLVREIKKGIANPTNPQHNYYSGNENSEDSVIYRLKDLYNERCAYCESDIDGFQIDHYRPIKGGKSENGSNISHQGYYWLCYEWTNLLLTCYACNSTHKGNQFPIEVEDYIDDSEFDNHEDISDDHRLLENLKQSESPLLLNPEEEGYDPENYFTFNANGIPEEKDGNIRAQKTISIVGLDRDPLVKKRLEIIDGLVNSINLAIGNMVLNEPNEGVIDHVKNGIEECFNNFINDIPNKEHSFFREYIIDRIEEFILPQFEGEEKRDFIQVIYNSIEQ